MASRRSAKKGFLAEYSVEDTYVLRPDRAIGRAGILRARNTESRDVLVKFWPAAKGVDNTDLEEIWRSEVRQLQRLAAVPRADELLVPLIASGQDAEGFYLVIDPVQGSALEEYLRAGKKPEMLAQARQPRARRALWANARRLAEALELLHSQGAIHRNLDPWAVVTALADEPDFRLTGFEWSMRIASVAGRQSKRVHAPRIEHSFSFARDWRDLALLFALILEIPRAPLGDMAVVPSRVVEHASAAEIRLLRVMLGLERVDRLDGEYVCDRIDEILDSISAEAAGKEARLCLSARLGSNSRLTDAVRAASGNEIEIADEAQQLKFIEDDLGRQPHLVSVKDHPDAQLRYALVGRLLTYRLAPYRPPGTAEGSNWEFAYCERADTEAPAHAAIVGETLLDAGTIELVRNQEATQGFARRRGKVLRWEQFLARAVPREERKTDLDRMHQSFALLLVLEMAYAAADIFPVEVVSQAPDSKSDYVIHVVSRADAERAKLSDLLGLESPANRLLRLLEGDELREEGAWTLSEPGMLGERSATTTSWRFVGKEEIEGLECLRFEGTAPAAQRVAAFLVPTGMLGRIAQFKRRLKALTALGQHTELLKMLADPRGRIDNSHDPLDEKSDAFKELDTSKQAALREILSTIPLFLLQGPPGVGKTYLVGDVVRRRLDDEVTTRILLSAQSNSAIDHLMSEVQLIFRGVPADHRPVMVRARPIDDDESAGEFEIDVQAERLLQTLAESELVSEARPHLCERVRELADARVVASRSRYGVGSTLGRRMSAELRAFEGMILRAANLVFATTNSYAVERLIDERGLFDWTIIEEAGKATGGELLSPLLLSHRRLMIGDHKQLPPFDVDRISKLLASTEKVREAVLLVDDLISRYLKDPSLDEFFREVEAGGEDFGRACADTLTTLTLFESIVEKELARQKRTGNKGRAIARRLTEQYRMHPAIARIVSRCFYDGELTTNRKKEEKFLSSALPFLSTDPKRLPEYPILFIDLPYSREEAPGGRSGDRPPPWSNLDEAKAAVDALSLLRVRNPEVPASLAVLSPYRQQVGLLRQRIARELDGRLSAIKAFVPAVDANEFCGTVDSFQGGEADIVFVSLVRNNMHSTPARALGFLRDNRRMNVLLSRAKWRLVLVGSLRFYQRIVGQAASVPDQDVGFLATFLDALGKASDAGEAYILSWSELKGGKP
jgi:AAA domain-containing protein